MGEQGRLRGAERVPACPSCEHAPECPHYDAAGRVPGWVDCPQRGLASLRPCPSCRRVADEGLDGLCRQCLE